MKIWHLISNTNQCAFCKEVLLDLLVLLQILDWDWRKIDWVLSPVSFSTSKRNRIERVTFCAHMLWSHQWGCKKKFCVWLWPPLWKILNFLPNKIPIYLRSDQGGRQRGGRGGARPPTFCGLKSSNSDVIMTSSLNNAPSLWKSCLPPCTVWCRLISRLVFI